MNRVTWNVRGAPKGKEGKLPELGDGRPLSQRPTLLLTALPDVYGEFAMAGYRYSTGQGRVEEVGLVLANMGAKRGLRDWAEHHQTKLLTLEEFGEGPLLRYGYRWKGTVVGFDLLQTFGLIAARAEPTRGGPKDKWVLAMPGWEYWDSKEKGRWRYKSGRMDLQISDIARGGSVAKWGYPQPWHGERRGVWVPDENGELHPWRGSFVDLRAASYAFSDCDRHRLGDHLRAWGLAGADLAWVLPAYAPGPEQAEVMVGRLDALQALADGVERAGKSLGVDPTRVWTPGTVASHLLIKAGAVPPQPPQAEEEPWLRTLHGGIFWAHPDYLGRPFEGVDWDVSSAYATVAALLGWWDHLAGGIVAEDVTEEFREFLASPDLQERMKEPAAWAHWGLTRCRLRLSGQHAPVELEGFGNLNRPGSDGGSGYWIPTRDWSACWAA